MSGFPQTLHVHITLSMPLGPLLRRKPLSQLLILELSYESDEIVDCPLGRLDVQDNPRAVELYGIRCLPPALLEFGEIEAQRRRIDEDHVGIDGQENANAQSVEFLGEPACQGVDTR
jgi:hypothetical protein